MAQDDQQLSNDKPQPSNVALAEQATRGGTMKFNEDSIFDYTRYPMLNLYVDPVRPPVREIVGREQEQHQILASLSRPEVSNVLLLAAAGTGKTVLVQSTMQVDHGRQYLEVDLSRMISELTNPDEMAYRIKRLFDEAETYSRDEGRQLVLFIDEFHQIVQLSPAAVEALKPILAASGARGILVIAATTYEEYHKYISANQPLVERLQRINLTPPDEEMTVKILRGMARKYGVSDQFYNDHIFHQIFELTNRYVPRSVQPRKSILVLDAMVGWHRFTGRPMNMQLLADVLMESTGVNIAFRVDGTTIKDQLDERVFAQKKATQVVARRLQLCVADLHDKSKPQSSFLFAGATGTGKAISVDIQVPIYDPVYGRGMIAAGDVKVGDYLFSRDGSPEKVIGVYPQGIRDMYDVRLRDGRVLRVDGEHLWKVYDCSPGYAHDDEGEVLTTLQLLDRGVNRPQSYWMIPNNEAVEWPERYYETDPFLIGQECGHAGTPCDDEYLYGSIEQRRAWLRGFISVRGDVDYTERVNVAARVKHKIAHIVCETDNTGVARQMYQVCLSLGYDCVVDDNHCVRLYGSVKLLSGLLPTNRAMGLERNIRTGANNITTKDRYSKVGIASIERSVEPTGDAVCFMVDHPEHLFQAGDFIVTHNTEMTKQLGRLLFGDDTERLIRFDMSEYALDKSLDQFRSELTQHVTNMGHAIILLDEIEKASSLILRMLYQVLDDGRLSDDNGRQVSFLNCYIIMTTNAGSEIFRTIGEYAADDEGSGENLEDFLKNIEASIRETAGFPDALLGRIDAIVPFQPLSLKTQERILKRQLLKLRNEVMLKHNVKLEIDPKVLTYLSIDKGDSDTVAGGARNAVRTLQTDVSTEVAEFLNKYPQVRHAWVGIEGKMRAEHKNLRKSQAVVVVKEVRD